MTFSRSALSPLVYDKEAESLRKAGYEVTIIAPTYAAEDITLLETSRPGVAVISLCILEHARRRTKAALIPRMFIHAWRSNADVYEAMEPMSLLIGAAIKLATRCRLIYDSRENYPLAHAVNTGLSPVSTKVLQTLFGWGEALLVAAFVDAVFAVNPSCVDRFTRLGKQTALLENYPRLEFAPEAGRTSDVSPNSDELRLVFAGNTNERIPVAEIIQAVALAEKRGTNVYVTFLGVSASEQSRRYWTNLADQVGVFDRVTLLKRIPNREVRCHLENADAGLMLYLPTPYTTAVRHVVKLFEYMAFGLPVLCSDFPIMSERVVEERVGLPADPSDPNSIADALIYLAKQAPVRAEMGRRARQAFETRYNWELVESDFVRAFEATSSRRTGRLPSTPASAKTAGD